MNELSRESIVVSIGYQKTELTVQQNNRVLWRCGYSSFGMVDAVIGWMFYLRLKRDLEVGRVSAEELILKAELAESPDEDHRPKPRIAGLSLISMLPQAIEFSQSEIRHLMKSNIDSLTDMLRQAFRIAPWGEIEFSWKLPDKYLPALSQGILRTGEYAHLSGLDRVLQEGLQLPVRVEPIAPWLVQE